MGAYRASPTGTRASLVQLFAAAVGVVFLLVGVAGFIPGLTTDYGEMRFAGHESEAMLLGVFQVSVLHNIVHLIFGVAGLVLARAVTTSLIFLVGGGIIYLLLWIYGLSIDHDSAANFIPVNTADDWLHFGLGIGMIGLGLLGWVASGGRRSPGVSGRRPGAGSGGP